MRRFRQRRNPDNGPDQRDFAREASARRPEADFGVVLLGGGRPCAGRVGGCNFPHRRPSHWRRCHLRISGGLLGSPGQPLCDDQGCPDGRFRCSGLLRRLQSWGPDRLRIYKDASASCANRELDVPRLALFSLSASLRAPRFLPILSVVGRANFPSRRSAARDSRKSLGRLTDRHCERGCYLFFFAATWRLMRNGAAT